MKFVLYRIGSNKANQPMRERAPVAIVEAANSDEAEATTWGDAEPSVHSCPYAVLAPHVGVYVNQRIEAVPLRRTSRADQLEARGGSVGHGGTFPAVPRETVGDD